MDKRVGKYEIKELLGQGGFGRVLRAYDPDMRRHVAIKILTSDDGPEALERFRDEAGFMRKLEHENIVTVYDFGEEGRSPFIVMELLDGKTLESVFKERQPLTLVQKLRIMNQIAEGLLYAHKKQVIHRDVKPGNVMWLPNGRVKLIDFGIARLLGSNSHQRTRNGQVVGTTYYMAPELLKGSVADAQSDVFAYGVLCYQLVSGTHPFEAEDRILFADPEPLGQIAEDCPEALESLIHRALAKEQMWRYPGFEELLLDAKPILLELEREQAANLTRIAAAAFVSGDRATAEQLVKDALGIESGNREAQDLWKLISEEKKRDYVILLEQQASDLLGNRQFVDACQKLEEALKLDTNNTKLSGLLENAKLKRKLSQEAGQKVNESKRKEHLGIFEDARKFALEALELDFGHPDAAKQLRLLDERALRQGGTTENATRLKRRLAEVSELRTVGKHSEGLTVLDSLSAEFPNTHVVENLRTLLREEMAAYVHTSERAALLTQARNCLFSKNAVEAIFLLEEARKRYPPDSVVEGWLIVAHAIAEVNSRERRLTALLAQALALRDNGQLEQAIRTLRNSQSLDGIDAQTTDLLRILEIEATQNKAVAELTDLVQLPKVVLASGPIKDGAKSPPEAEIPRRCESVPGAVAAPTIQPGRIQIDPPARNCAACGALLPDNARFCDGCGKSVVSRLF